MGKEGGKKPDVGVAAAKFWRCTRYESEDDGVMASRLSAPVPYAHKERQGTHTDAT